MGSVSIDKQKLKFSQISWEKENQVSTNSVEFENNHRTGNIDSKPLGLRSGMPNDDLAPYWVYDYDINDEGYSLRLRNIAAKNTVSEGSIEPIFESIVFTELEVEMEDKTIVGFDISNALKNDESKFWYAENGTSTECSPNCNLYQRGYNLVLVDNILDSGDINSANYCKVKLELSVVFRGAKNDFDPGGIPVAIDIFPQIGWTWYNEEGKTSLTVKRFRGTVIFDVINQMYMSHNDQDMEMDMEKNIASLFTDTNNAMDDKYTEDSNVDGDRSAYYDTLDYLAATGNRPRTWGTLFDYADLNLKKEKEFIAVYSALDSDWIIEDIDEEKWKERERTGNYIWLKDYYIDKTGTPFDSKGIPINIYKHGRQGSYDNIHIHGKMPNPNPQKEPNEPIHAPFCGHSCVHFHWRWTPYAIGSADPDKKSFQYKGWNLSGQSNVEPMAPLIPYNQRLRFAITDHSRYPRIGRDSNYNPDDDPIIIDEAKALDDRAKILWYAVDVKQPNAGQTQVILEQGVGWAYRYTKPTEVGIFDSAVRDLILGTPGDDLPYSWNWDQVTQKEMNEFFSERVYPSIRYIDVKHIESGNKERKQQIPSGTFNGNNNNQTSLEDL